MRAGPSNDNQTDHAHRPVGDGEQKRVDTGEAESLDDDTAKVVGNDHARLLEGPQEREPGTFSCRLHPSVGEATLTATSWNRAEPL
jgi:hypothetical protein